MEDVPVPHVEEMDISDVPETDILFECPDCGKSLSIDQRGAGLVIRCTQCGRPVTVPIPAGMEIEDFDATPEELSSQLLYARQTLAKAQSRLKELEEEAIELRGFKERALRKQEQMTIKFEALHKTLEDVLAIHARATERVRSAQSLVIPELPAPETPEA